MSLIIRDDKLQIWKGKLLFCAPSNGDFRICEFTTNNRTFLVMVPCESCVELTLSGVQDDYCLDCDDFFNGTHVLGPGTCAQWLGNDVQDCDGIDIPWSFGLNIFIDNNNDLIFSLDLEHPVGIDVEFDKVLEEDPGDGNTVCVDLRILNENLNFTLNDSECDFSSATANIAWTDCP